MQAKCIEHYVNTETIFFHSQFEGTNPAALYKRVKMDGGTVRKKVGLWPRLLSRDAGVNLLCVVGLDLGDLSLLCKVLASSASERRVDLESLAQSRGSHELHLGHLSLETDPAILVKENLGV